MNNTIDDNKEKSVINFNNVENITDNNNIDNDDKIEIDKELYLYLNNNKLYHISELFNSVDNYDSYSLFSLRKQFEEYKKTEYKHIIGEDIYELEYDNGALRIPDLEIEITNDSDPPLLDLYDEDRMKLYNFYVNEDFNTLYIKKVKKLNRFIMTSILFLITFVILLQFYSLSVLTVIFGLIIGSILEITALIILTIFEKLDLIYRFKELYI